MPTVTHRSTAALLGMSFAASALGVHHLRYWLAYGDAAGTELAHQGHGYLMLVTPAIVGALALALGWRLAILFAGGHGGRTPVGRPARWLSISLALLCVYVTQESAEGLLAAGHPAGVAAVFGNGGWLAIPVTFVVGGILSLVARGVSEAGLSAIALLPPRHPSARLRVVGAALLSVATSSPLARHLAGRAPPVRVY